MRCNICGGTAFSDMPKRPKVRCVACGSLERTRVAALYLTGEDRPRRGQSVLHFAPERGLSRVLRDAAGDGYRALDIDPPRYPDLDVERFDLCRDVFALEEGSADLIIHNHVIEHLECNYTVVLARLARTLKPSGVMLFSLPILPGGFTDELIDAPLEEKQRHFGDALHVRRFGTDVLQQTLGMIFHLPARYDLTARFAEDTLREANIPAHHWRDYTGTSILRVGRADLRI